MQQTVIIPACFHFHWNTRFPVYSPFLVKGKSDRFVVKPLQKLVKGSNNSWYFYALYINLTAIRNILILPGLLDLIFNYGNAQEFKKSSLLLCKHWWSNSCNPSRSIECFPCSSIVRYFQKLYLIRLDVIIWYF